MESRRSVASQMLLCNDWAVEIWGTGKGLGYGVTNHYKKHYGRIVSNRVTL